MIENITIERHGSDWCLKDGQGNCLIVTPDRAGLDRIVWQMKLSKGVDKLLAAPAVARGQARA